MNDFSKGIFPFTAGHVFASFDGLTVIRQKECFHQNGHTTRKGMFGHGISIGKIGHGFIQKGIDDFASLFGQGLDVAVADL